MIHIERKDSFSANITVKGSPAEVAADIQAFAHLLLNRVDLMSMFVHQIVKLTEMGPDELKKSMFDAEEEDSKWFKLS